MTIYSKDSSLILHDTSQIALQTPFSSRASGREDAISRENTGIRISSRESTRGIVVPAKITGVVYNVYVVSLKGGLCIAGQDIR